MAMVSIGMPVFNGEKNIKEAIESLINQTFIDIELIISDNASTDSTSSICQSYAKADHRIKYIRQSSNIGAHANFLYVLNSASGEYFMWAAHDDIWSKEWIEVLLSNYSSGNIISFGNVVNIDEGGVILKKYNFDNFTQARFFRSCKFYLQEDTKGKANYIYGIYKKSQLINIGFSQFQLDSYGEDMRFIFTCLQYGTIICDKSVFLYKRVENRVFKQYTFKKIIRSLLIIDRIKTYLRYSISVKSKWEQFFYKILFPHKYSMSLIYNFFFNFLKFFK
jgi:glycosyltransferase involved in cell wall biosynthesis